MCIKKLSCKKSIDMYRCTGKERIEMKVSNQYFIREEEKRHSQESFSRRKIVLKSQEMLGLRIVRLQLRYRGEGLIVLIFC